MSSRPKKLLLPTLLTFAGISILCSLGVWQLQRLEWKTSLIETLDAEYPKDATQNIITGQNLENYEAADKKNAPLAVRGTVTGTYDLTKQILVGTRFYDNLPGKHVLTPLQMDDGTWLLVNRGWVSQSWKPVDEANPPPNGTVSITGLLRRPTERNPFTPDNKPLKDEWYYPDLEEIADVKNISGTIHEYILHQEKDENSASTADYPIAEAAKPVLDNNHLQYAIFWFSMAAILFVIYVLRFLRK